MHSSDIVTKFTADRRFVRIMVGKKAVMPSWSVDQFDILSLRYGGLPSL